MTTLDLPRGDVAVVVPAAGAGLRLGPGGPKALRRLGDVPLLIHAIRRIRSAGSVGWVAVAAPPGQEGEVARLLGPEVSVVSGGADRQESVALALTAVPPRFDLILVHDAARALTPPSLVEEVAAAVRAGHDAVVPVLPVTDTITQVGPTGEVIGQLDRATLRAVQTPQGFRRAVLVAAHAAATGAAATDDAGLVARLGVPVHTVAGSPLALKITHPQDLRLAEALLAGDG